MTDRRREHVIFPEAILTAFRDSNPAKTEREVNAMQAPWDDVPSETRAALATLVRDALVRMAENVEEWLPEAAVAKPNETMGIFVQWKLGHIDEEIIRQRARADADSEKRLADLKRIAGRRHGHDDPSS